MRKSDDPLVTGMHWFLGILGAGMILSTCSVDEARAHDWYPQRCCWGPSTGRTGDCDMIPTSTVRETALGYQVTLNPGDHPLIKDKPASFLIPYGQEEVSKDGQYHLCINPYTMKHRCFFAGARGS